MRAWLFQDHRQKQKLGDKCPWSVGWIDPAGKRRSQRRGSKSNAEKFARKIEGQLAAGTYADVSKTKWADFIAEHKSKVLGGQSVGTRAATLTALKNFQRLAKPVTMRGITTATVDGFIAARRAERVKDDKAVSPATVNRDLRHLRAVLRKATKWGYLIKCPDFTFLREPGKLPSYVTPEHFAAIYKAAITATLPAEQPFTPAAWWQGLLVLAYMTGWRIGSILALQWTDVDLNAGTALSRAENNKGRRDQQLPLHSVVVEHLKRIKSFSPIVFVWPLDRHELYEEFGRLQAVAGVKPSYGKRRYGFHDLRRAFATLNATTLSADALQALMQHKSYVTTQRYINMANQMTQAVEKLYVPEVARIAATG
jgi:integrase